MTLRLGIPLAAWKKKWTLLTEESRYWVAAWSLAQTIREFQPALTPDSPRKEATTPDL